MDGKITLITPPDIFENSNISVLFMHLSEKDQITVSEWLSQSKIKDNINFYVYSGESNIDWLFYAVARCEYKYIDLNDQNYITQALSGHFLSKENIFYKTSNENIAAVYSHINHNRVENVNQFLEIILGEQE